MLYFGGSVEKGKRYRFRLINAGQPCQTITVQGVPKFNFKKPTIFFEKTGTTYQSMAGVSMCPVEFSVEGHTLTVIATDGIDIEPVLAGTCGTTIQELKRG